MKRVGGAAAVGYRVGERADDVPELQHRVGYGYTGTKGLNVQVAALSTPTAAPVIAGTRLRKGNTSSAHGAPRLIGDAVATAKKAGPPGW